MADGAGWWAELYDDTTADLFLVRSDPAELEPILGFLTEHLALGPGARVFDQCCGIGTLAVPLAGRGAQVIGVDQSPAYIARARRLAAEAGVPCRFHAADAFAFVPEERCDAAFNWGTGFGNTADNRHNRRMLERAHDALRPGGRFVLDFQNVARILADFQPVLLRRHATPQGEVLLLRESTLALDEGLLRQRWTYLFPDGQRRVAESAVRLYLPHELIAALTAAGFAGVALYGDVDGSPLTRHSPRCLLSARRRDR